MKNFGIVLSSVEPFLYSVEVLKRLRQSFIRIIRQPEGGGRLGMVAMTYIDKCQCS